MDNQISDYKLNGLVKKYNSLEKRINDNNEMIISNKTYILFNRNGFVIENSETNHSGVGRKISYTYDNRGNLTEKIFHTSDGSSYAKLLFDDNVWENIHENFKTVKKNPYSKFSYIYDTNNNLIEENIYLLKNPPIRTVNKFNSRGNKIEIISYYVNGQLSDIQKIEYEENSNLNKKTASKIDVEDNTIYKNDKNGFKIESLRTNKEGVAKRLEKWKYDDRGNILESTIFFPDKNISFRSVLKYDKWNNQIEEIKYNKDGELDTIWAKKFDEKARIIERYHRSLKYLYKNKAIDLNSFTPPVSTKKYSENKNYFKFDDQDNIIEEIKHNYYDDKLLNTIISYFIFDDKNNLVNKTVVKDDVIIEITEIKIKYFE